MKTLPLPRPDFVFCVGQAPDGSKVCGYREGCKRFLEAGHNVNYEPYWKGGDDCLEYKSKKS